MAQGMFAYQVPEKGALDMLPWALGSRGFPGHLMLLGVDCRVKLQNETLTRTVEFPGEISGRDNIGEPGFQQAP